MLLSTPYSTELIKTDEKSLWKSKLFIKLRPFYGKSTVSPKDKISTPLATQSAQKTGRKIARPRFFCTPTFVTGCMKMTGLFYTVSLEVPLQFSNKTMLKTPGV